MVHYSSSGRIYGAEPKCVRVREIHRLLFYLIHGYTGVVDGDQTEMKEAILKDNPNVTKEQLEGIPHIYQVRSVLYSSAYLFSSVSRLLSDTRKEYYWIFEILRLI